MSRPMLRVKATAKCRYRFPMEEFPRQYIGEQVRPVPSSPYYRRAIADGDLELMTVGKEKPE